MLSFFEGSPPLRCSLGQQQLSNWECQTMLVGAVKIFFSSHEYQSAKKIQYLLNQPKILFHLPLVELDSCFNEDWAFCEANTFKKSYRFDQKPLSPLLSWHSLPESQKGSQPTNHPTLSRNCQYLFSRLREFKPFSKASKSTGDQGDK